jgi:hypothetical protein
LSAIFFALAFFLFSSKPMWILALLASNFQCRKLEVEFKIILCSTTFKLSNLELGSCKTSWGNFFLCLACKLSTPKVASQAQNVLLVLFFLQSQGIFFYVQPPTFTIECRKPSVKQIASTFAWCRAKFQAHNFQHQKLEFGRFFSSFICTLQKST